jgi:hypothetical protein
MIMKEPSSLRRVGRWFRIALQQSWREHNRPGREMVRAVVRLSDDFFR